MSPGSRSGNQTSGCSDDRAAIRRKKKKKNADKGFFMLFSTKDKEKKGPCKKKQTSKREKGAFVSNFNANTFFILKRLFFPSLSLTAPFLACFSATVLHKSGTVICLIIIIYCLYTAGIMLGTSQHGDEVSAPENTSAHLTPLYNTGTVFAL